MDGQQIVLLAYWQTEQIPLECRDKVEMEAQMYSQKFNAIMSEIPLIMHSCKGLPCVP